MSNTKSSAIVVRAIDFAVNHHKNDIRKGTKIPYLVHLLSVQGILADVGADDEVIAAGLLHDIVEDTSVTIGMIKSEFGDRITGIVTACTEKYKLEKSNFNAADTWKERKEHTIKEIIPNATSDQLLVMLADKLDNIRSIQRDYEHLKDKLWERFNASKYQQKWYYKSLTLAASNNPNINEQGKRIIEEIWTAFYFIFTELSESDVIKIVIANDHKIMRDALKMTFKKIDNYIITGESSTFKKTIEIIDQTNPNVLLIDDQMPEGDIRSCIGTIKQKNLGLKIIVQSWFGPDAEHFKQIMPIMNGWVSAAAGARSYIEAIETVYLGGFYGFIPGFRKKENA